MTFHPSKEKSIATVRELGLQQVLFDALIWYQNTPGEKNVYHTSVHANKVIEGLFYLTEPDASLILAAKWHDAIYIPGAGSDANERCSAAALEQSFKNRIPNPTEMQTDVILKAKMLIQYTSIDYHFSRDEIRAGGLEYLLDADLWSLSADWDIFVKNQENIITENYGDREKDKNLSANFLKTFLTVREFIYHTEFARANWEQRARNNITKYAQLYSD
jgi:predicted metal-dependent HD superfamily phosphohydrolase